MRVHVLSWLYAELTFVFAMLFVPRGPAAMFRVTGRSTTAEMLSSKPPDRENARRSAVFYDIWPLNRGPNPWFEATQ